MSPKNKADSVYIFDTYKSSWSFGPREAARLGPIALHWYGDLYSSLSSDVLVPRETLNRINNVLIIFNQINNEQCTLKYLL